MNYGRTVNSENVEEIVAEIEANLTPRQIEARAEGDVVRAWRPDGAVRFGPALGAYHDPRWVCREDDQVREEWER
jgi:hypothetical protein